MCKGLTFSAVLLLWVGVAAGQSASTNSQTQTQPSQNSTRTNPQSPSTPLGASPVQNIPGTQSPSAQNSSSSTSQPSARPPANVDVQTIQPAPTGADQAPVNTEVHAVLDTPLSTRTSNPGDRFTATVTDPVRGSNGSVIVPAGARLEGEVAHYDQLNAIPALRGRTKLSLRFRDIVLPTGQAVPLAATLISVNTTNGKSANTG